MTERAPPGYEILRVSDHNYEDLVAEISHESAYIATITREPGRDFEIELADATARDGYRRLNLAEFLRAVEIARARLEP
jgi:hypothetical protein